jgi:hypothetical protein
MIILFQGDLRNAVKYFVKALKIKENLLGPKHMDVATSHIYLSSCMDGRGRKELASQHLQVSLSILSLLSLIFYQDCYECRKQNVFFVFVF